ncbi:MAG: FAD-dependent monooxygenase, partial [Gammaproteobacteria bacterium]|nr:FAD-dependent monooxygenase [Gammaproteobacteria bacterium]
QLNIQYATFVDHLIDQGDNVVVTFNNKIEKTYDLVIGADGIHSHTREIIFGDENQFSKDLRYQLAATIQPNNVDIIDSFYTYSTFDKQVAICPIRNNQLSVYFIYRNEEKKLIDPKEKLYDAFKNDGWIIPRILESTLKSETIIFDHLSQIQMPSWYRGRVVLVGDACQCLTLVSGQGASMAMAGAYILATLLHQHSHNFQEALIQYQTIMKPDIDRKQTVAREFLNTFVLNPESAQLSRNYFTRQFFKSMYVKSAVDEFCR